MSAYFDALVARPTCRFAYALRRQAEIDALASRANTDGTLLYDPVMDACRLTIPARRVVDGAHTGVQSSLSPQLWCPLRLEERGQHVIIWDWYPDASMSAANGFITHKAWMVRISGAAGARIWLEPDHDYLADGRTVHSRVRGYAQSYWPDAAYGPPPQTIAPGAGFRIYSPDGDRTDAAGGRYHQYNSEAIGPVGANVFLKTGEWIRKMLVLEQREDGFVETSFYVCSESLPVTCVLDKVLIGLPRDERPIFFAYHLNDSFLRARDGTEAEMAAIVPAVSWGRNVVVLRGEANPLELLQQPEHELPIPWRPRPPSDLRVSA